jgi:DNA (cytosine-5)-methyltransferase 1
VFVVASAREGFDPAAVLFEFEGVRRDTAPSREAGKVAPTIPARSLGGGGLGTGFDCDGGLIPATVGTLCAADGKGKNGQDAYDGKIFAVPFDTTQVTSAANYSNPQPGDHCHPLNAGAHAPAIAFPANLSGTQYASTENLAPSMGAKNPTAVAVALRGREGGATAELGDEVQNCLRAGSGGGDKPYVLVNQTYAVRRLTVEECESLQGFPRGYTRIPWRGKPADQCPDGPRYKALGNSWAVPVVRWIGERINAAVEQIKHERRQHD